MEVWTQGVYELRIEGGREGCGRGRGDVGSLGTEQLAAASSQHRDQ